MLQRVVGRQLIGPHRDFSSLRSVASDSYPICLAAFPVIDPGLVCLEGALRLQKKHVVHECTFSGWCSSSSSSSSSSNNDNDKGRQWHKKGMQELEGRDVAKEGDDRVDSKVGVRMVRQRFQWQPHTPEAPCPRREPRTAPLIAPHSASLVSPNAQKKEAVPPPARRAHRPWHVSSRRGGTIAP